MAQEIERKFLVTDTSWRHHATRKLYRQGYIATRDKTTVRVRIVGEQGYLTIKGAATGISRLEFEYPIPFADANEILASLCQSTLIEKWRHTLRIGNHVWEIDEFLGDNQGLMIAEIELSSSTEKFLKPSWVGKEVSEDPRYYNANLAKQPYKLWQSVVQL